MAKHIGSASVVLNEECRGEEINGFILTLSQLSVADELVIYKALHLPNYLEKNHEK